MRRGRKKYLNYMKFKFLTLTAFAVLSLLSCQKDDAGDDKKYCYACTMVNTVTMGTNEPNITEVEMDQCDLTEKEMKMVQEQSNTTGTSGDITSKTVMNCTKK